MPSVWELLEAAALQHEDVVEKFESDLAFARHEIARLRAALAKEEGKEDIDIDITPNGQLFQSSAGSNGFVHKAQLINDWRERSGRSNNTGSHRMTERFFTNFSFMGISGLCPCFGMQWQWQRPDFTNILNAQSQGSMNLPTTRDPSPSNTEPSLSDVVGTPDIPHGGSLNQSLSIEGSTPAAENQGEMNKAANIIMEETVNRPSFLNPINPETEWIGREHSNRRRSLSRKFEEEEQDHECEMNWAKYGEPPLRCNWVADAVSSMRFEILCSVVVILNMLCMTWYYDDVVQNPTMEGSTEFFYKTEIIFCVWYLMELLLRVVPFGLNVFNGPERKWLLFDLVLVFISLLSVAYPNNDAGDMDPLRISKLVKLLRVLRASRMLKLARLMRQSVQFSLLFNLLGSAMGCFFWACFTAMMVTYTFGLLLLSQAGEYLRQNHSEANPELKEEIKTYMGSLGQTILTCFMAVSGGLEWNDMLGMLSELGPLAFFTMILYVLLSEFLIANLALALFFQSTMKTIYNNDRETLSMHMQKRHRYIEALKEVFGGSEWVTWPMFHQQESHPKVRDILSLLRIERSQVRKLFQILSGNGEHSVNLHNFIIGCINLKRAVTTMDLMEVAMMHSDFLDEQTHLVMNAMNRSSTLESLANKSDVHELVSDVAPEVFAKQLFYVARLSAREAGGCPTAEVFLKSVHRVADMALLAEGGCGFVIAPCEAFRWLQEVHRVDFQVVDRSQAFPSGYMTQRLKDVHVEEEDFLQAVCELSRHSDNDRWPDDHEAAGLPKDGYMLISHEGKRVLCTARMVGLPTPPYQWDGVGTRHMAAVAVAHALSRWPCAVIVRSDSGKVHGICPSQKRSTIRVVGCRVKDDSHELA